MYVFVFSVSNTKFFFSVVSIDMDIKGYDIIWVRYLLPLYVPSLSH